MHELEKKFSLWVHNHSSVLDRPLSIAVSGGLDSVVLLDLVYRQFQTRKWNFEKLCVFHVHHGGEARYRREAQDFVRKFCLTRQILFFTNSPEKELSLNSEAELRAYRLSWFRRWSAQIEKETGSFPFVFLAHHEQDLLETRLLRLIRGTGPQGLASMTEFHGRWVRPFLTLSRETLVDYAKVTCLKWIEDPTNQDTDWTRNWLRHRWLVDLETRLPGATARLGQSLNQISVNTKHSELQIGMAIISGGIDRTRYWELSLDSKRAALAHYLRSLNLKNYTFAHVLELVKRLDTPRKQFTFQMLKQQWMVSAKEIRAKPLQNASTDEFSQGV